MNTHTTSARPAWSIKPLWGIHKRISGGHSVLSPHYPDEVGQLTVRAIDPILQNGVKGFLRGMIRGARWELTCGLCRERFGTLQHLFSPTAECPHGGTRNLLTERV